MDEDCPEADFDTVVRLHICDFVNDMAERACTSGGSAFDTPEQFIAAAEMIEHYIQQGGTVSFDCTDSLHKTVRGGI